MLCGRTAAVVGPLFCYSSEYKAQFPFQIRTMGLTCIRVLVPTYYCGYLVMNPDDDDPD